MPLSGVTQNTILSGLNSSTDLFFVFGGTILVVSAGLWGFGRVRDLLEEKTAPEWKQRGYSSQADMDQTKYYFARLDAQESARNEHRQRKYENSTVEHDQALEARYYRRFGSEAWERRYSL